MYLSRTLGFLYFLFYCLTAHSSTIAVIDSGTDLKHKVLAPQSWVNPVEIPDNLRDEDGNGYQDDVHGWNFAEQNNQIIDYKYLGLLDDRIRKFFTIQAKMLTGKATSEDIAWMRKQRQDQQFLKKLQTYGNFMHGTHVAGIAAKDAGANENMAKVLAVKLIPTEIKLPGSLTADKNFGIYLLKKFLENLSKQQMNLLEEIAVYINGHKANIANGSFGTGYTQASMIVKTLFKTLLRRDPTQAELHDVTSHFLNSLISEGKRMITSAPNTLFVFAAGNDGKNNDTYPTSPANIKGDNVITVAATIERHTLASFSNFGINSVHVAAPGVAISAPVPGNKFLKVSGTSQAAPYVSNIANSIKDINPKLTPKQIKKILIGTVDPKEYLKGKVSSAGIVNGKRAMRAAEISLKDTVAEAITKAKEEIADIESLEKSAPIFPVENPVVLPLPGLFAL